MTDRSHRNFRSTGKIRPFATRLVLGALFVVVGVAVSAGTTWSAEPTAEALLDKYVEAMGGKAAMEKIQNRVTRGKLEMAAQGLEMTLTIYSARPNLNYTLIESDMTGKIEKGCDGEIVWENSVMMGAQVKEGKERADTRREATLDKWLHWRDFYPEVEYVGAETLNDRPVHKVVVTPEEGSPQTLYLDQDSNLAVRVDMVVENPMGTFPVVSYLSDYQEIDGILVPYTVEVEVMGQKRVIKTESVEHNVELPADRFALPAEIRALLEREADDATAGAESTNE